LSTTQPGRVNETSARRATAAPARAEQGGPARPDRRQALGLGAWAAALAATGSLVAHHRAAARTAGTRTLPAATTAQPTIAVAAPIAAAPTPPPTGDASTGGLLVGDALVLHVARRLSFGPTPALLDEIRAAGVDAWTEQQLQPGSIDDRAVDEQLEHLHDLRTNAAAFRDTGRSGEHVLADLRTAAVLRATQSRRHLLEVMVDLWHDRLAASSAKAPVEWHLPAYDREAIRPHALGRFADLLQAATRSGAMLEYLDTTSSRAPDVNENHGRELLELHTVGRDAGYGEPDVLGAARVLSGWRHDRDQLTVVFDPSIHHSGPATVLGWSTPGRSGPAAADDLTGLLDHLARHPATARRVAVLLVTRFVGEPADAALVESTAAAYLAHDTDIAATLRHVVTSATFRAGGTPLARRPFDLLAAHLRAVGASFEISTAAERLLPVDDVLVRVPLAAMLSDPLGEPVTASLLEPLTGPAMALAGAVEGAIDGANDAVDPALGPTTSPLLPQRPVARTLRDLLAEHGQLVFAAPHPSGHAFAGSAWTTGDALLRRWTLAARSALGHLEGIMPDPAVMQAAETVGATIDAMAARALGVPPSPGTRASVLAALGAAEGDPVTEEATGARVLALLLAAPEAQLR